MAFKHLDISTVTVLLEERGCVEQSNECIYELQTQALLFLTYRIDMQFKSRLTVDLAIKNSRQISRFDDLHLIRIRSEDFIWLSSPKNSRRSSILCEN